MKSLRSECSQSCPNVVTSCSLANPDVYNRSTAFFTTCQNWCCTKNNTLAIALFAVVGTVVLLLMVFVAIVLKKMYRKRSREQIMGKTQWRPATRDAFALGGDEEGHNHFRVGEADGDMQPHQQLYLHSKHGATLGEESGALFQHRVGNENPYLVGGVVGRRGSNGLGHLPLPPDPSAGGDNAAAGHGGETRRSFMYDGEISLGFADEDFYIVEADRADGVSFAGSRMSRRSSTRSGAVALPMSHVKDPTASASTSQQISPRSDAGDAAFSGMQHHHNHRTTPLGDQQDRSGYWGTVDHRGRPLSASKATAQQQQQQTGTTMPHPGGVSPRPPLSTQRGSITSAPPPAAVPAYVGLANNGMSVGHGGTPGQRPLSGSVRRQSAAAVTWDIFEDVDVAELERTRSLRQQPPQQVATSGQYTTMVPPSPSTAPAPPPPPGHLTIGDLFGSNTHPPLPPVPNTTTAVAIPVSSSAPHQRRGSAGIRRVSATAVPSSDYLWDAEIDAEIFDV